MKYRLRMAGTGLVVGFASVICSTMFGETPPFFTEGQGRAGQEAYRQNCTACHGPLLEGGEQAPPLKGEAFWSEWDTRTARNLYSRIISTMPPSDPGSLKENDVVSIVAYIAQANGLPAGNKAAENANALNSVRLERPK